MLPGNPGAGYSWIRWKSILDAELSSAWPVRIVKKPESYTEDKDRFLLSKMIETLAGWAIILVFVAIAALIGWIVWAITGLFY